MYRSRKDLREIVPEPPSDFPSFLMARTCSCDLFLTNQWQGGWEYCQKLRLGDLSFTCILAMPEKSCCLNHNRPNSLLFLGVGPAILYIFLISQVFLIGRRGQKHAFTLTITHLLRLGKGLSSPKHLATRQLKVIGIGLRYDAENMMESVCCAGK